MSYSEEVTVPTRTVAKTTYVANMRKVTKKDTIIPQSPTTQYVSDKNMSTRFAYTKTVS